MNVRRTFETARMVSCLEQELVLRASCPGAKRAREGNTNDGCAMKVNNCLYLSFDALAAFSYDAQNFSQKNHVRLLSTISRNERLISEFVFVSNETGNRRKGSSRVGGIQLQE